MWAVACLTSFFHEYNKVRSPVKGSSDQFSLLNRLDESFSFLTKPSVNPLLPHCNRQFKCGSNKIKLSRVWTIDLAEINLQFTRLRGCQLSATEPGCHAFDTNLPLSCHTCLFLTLTFASSKVVYCSGESANLQIAFTEERSLQQAASVRKHRRGALKLNWHWAVSRANLWPPHSEPTLLTRGSWSEIQIQRVGDSLQLWQR